MDDDTKAELLNDHYKETYNLALRTWNYRNRIFLILLAVVGGATLLTFEVDGAEPLLVDIIAGFFDITDCNTVTDLRTSFPFGLIQSILLMIILYLNVQLFHRTINIARYYKYIEKLELEIREILFEKDYKENFKKESNDQESTNQSIRELLLKEDYIASFTRESKHYASTKHFLSGWIQFAYFIMLGGLLSAFISGRIISDFSNNQHWLLIASDIIISLAILLSYFGYVDSAAELNFFERFRKEEEKDSKKKSDKK